MYAKRLFSKQLVYFSMLLTGVFVAEGRVIADFPAEFNPRTPEDGWAYQWNPAGVEIGSSSGYVDLQNVGNCAVRIDSERKQSDKSLGDGQGICIKDENAIWGAGRSCNSSSDGYSHCVIAAYTVQEGESGFCFVTGGAQLMNDAPAGEVFIYVNDTFIQKTMLNTGEKQFFEFSLGEVKDGDVIYVALGSVNSKKRGVSASIQYTIETKQTPQKTIVLG